MFLRHPDGDVILKMSPDDYDTVLMALGYFTGGMSKHNPQGMNDMLKLINRLNDGNPQYTPYETK